MVDYSTRISLDDLDPKDSFVVYRNAGGTPDEKTVLVSYGELFDDADPNPVSGPYSATAQFSDVASSKPSPPRVWRVNSRFLGGNAVLAGNNRSGASATDQTWLPANSDGPTYLVRDPEFVWMAENGGMAISGLTKSSRAVDAAIVPIAICGYCEVDKAAQTGWVYYADMVLRPSAGAVQAWGFELALKNQGDNYTSGAYGSTPGIHGIWLPAGGDASYGGAPTNPNNTAIMIGANSSTWNKGIVFLYNGLTGSDGVTGGAVAIEMPKTHRVQWLKPNGNLAFSITSGLDDADPAASVLVSGSSIIFSGANGNSTARLTQTTNQVNYLRMTGAVAGAGPLLSAAGDDTNVDLNLAPKGSGNIRFGTHGSIAAETVTGYITVKDAAGNSRKLAVVS